MLRVSIIFCCDAKNGISKNNKIPWTHSGDRKMFVKLTKKENNVVIFGKNSFLEIDRPLPGRINYVLSTSLIRDDVKIFRNMDKLIAACLEHTGEVFVCGGIPVIESFFNHPDVVVEKMYITKMDKDYQCDNFFDTKYCSQFPHVAVYHMDNNTDLYFYTLN